nr:MAG TPA: hypothetical protein [Caudoviricetes sp.]
MSADAMVTAELAYSDALHIAVLLGRLAREELAFAEKYPGLADLHLADVHRYRRVIDALDTAREHVAPAASRGLAESRAS